MRRWLLVLLVFSLATCVWGSNSDEEDNEENEDRVEESKNEEEIPSIRIFGKVTAGPDHAPVSGATVSLPGRSATTREDGTFSFEKVPQERQTTLNLRVLDDQGDVIGCSAIALTVDHLAVAADSAQGFTVEVVGTRQDVELELKLVKPAGAELNAYCSTCHRPNPCTAGLEKSSSWDSVEHLGGVAVPLSELEDFKERLTAKGVDPGMVRNLRYRDIHPHERDLRNFTAPGENDAEPLFKLPDALPMGDPPILLCETCHTHHQETDQQSFLRLEFIEKNTLCTQCHK